MNNKKKYPAEVYVAAASIVLVCITLVFVAGFLAGEGYALNTLTSALGIG